MTLDQREEYERLQHIADCARKNVKAQYAKLGEVRKALIQAQATYDFAFEDYKQVERRMQDAADAVDAFEMKTQER